MDIEKAIKRIEELKEEPGIPSNIRNLLDRCIETLQEEDEDLSVRINTATSILDQISNDPNIQQHTRTSVWNIASILESAGNGD